MENWVSTSTSDKEIKFEERNELFEAHIKKAVLERTADGKVKSLHIDFIV